jgi:hypothetical protein
VLGLAILRWLSVLAAFIALLTTGRLNGWGHNPVVRAILVISGITMLEICMFPILLRCIDEAVAPHLQLALKCLLILLPLGVIAGGYLGSRVLFAFGAVGALAAAVWPIPKYTEPPPDPNSVEYILQHVDPEADLKDVLARLEKHPDWVKQVSRSLDVGPEFNAAVLLSLKPAALSGDVQERCWKVALSYFDQAKQVHDHGENWMPGEVRGVAVIVQGLTSIPGAARDRHRHDFVIVRNLVNFYRNETPETRHPELPDLNLADWVAVGN